MNKMENRRRRSLRRPTGWRMAAATAILSCALALAAPMTAAAASSPAQKLPVLMYHSILGGEYYTINANNQWVLSEEKFAEQMKYLHDNKFTTVTSEQLIDFLYNKVNLPGRSVLLTFDDGYLDNAVFAYPIMKEYGFTGIVFTVTSFITETQGNVAAYPLQYMSLTDMENTTDVFEYGSHSHDMHRLYRNTPVTLRASQDELREDLRTSFGYPLTLRNGYAYPYGEHNSRVRSALQAENIKFAFTTKSGYITMSSSPLTLNRFAITGDMSLEKFSEIVSGGIWAGSAGGTAAGDATAGTTMTVTASTLNVRAGAGTNYRTIGTLKHGDTVCVTGTTGQWRQIAWQGGVAYVHGSYLK